MMLHTLDGLDYMRPDDLDNFLDEIYAVRKEAKAPTHEKPVTQFENEMQALKTFFDGDEPLHILVRSGSISNVFYGFGDASGNSFSSAVQSREGLSIRMGVWGHDKQAESSNFREFENLSQHWKLRVKKEI